MKRNSLENTLFEVTLPAELEYYIYETNPWWRGKPARPLPSFKRWLFRHTLERLKGGLAPVTVLRGPRQVGKTTLQQQIIQHLLQEEKVSPTQIFRVQFDEIPSLQRVADPILTFSRWFQNRILKKNI